jgi:hypothetical protein
VIVNLTDDSAEMPLSTVLQYLHDGLRGLSFGTFTYLTRNRRSMECL